MIRCRKTIRLSAFGAALALACLALPGESVGASLENHISDINARVDSDLDYLRNLYVHFHRNPELSYHEKETAARMADELERIGFQVTPKVGGHGVVGVLKNGDGPTVLVRGDMDALPVKEETGRPYASTVVVKDELGRDVNVMHACGHDIHMTSLIGTARLLSGTKDAWNGTLIIIAQPAEERGGGAKAMIEDGLFKRFPRPDYVLGLHVSSEMEAGKIAYVEGFSMANVDSVDIKIRGIGGHGAQPQATKDPVVVAAQVILNLQTIVSRELLPLDPAVVTVGSIHGGTKHNIIPNEVDLQLTVRTYKDEVRDHVLESIERIAVQTARVAGLPEDRLPIVSHNDVYTPATYNTPELVQRSVAAINAILGEGNVVEGQPTMGGEDFGRYGREEPRIPIFMYWLGSISKERMEASRKPGGEPLPSLHSSKYYPEPEPTIRTGVRSMSAAVIDLFNE